MNSWRISVETTKIKSDIVCLADYAPENIINRMLGFLKDEYGKMVYSSEGPVRIKVPFGSEYITYEDFHGSDEWKQILREKRWKL